MLSCFPEEFWTSLGWNACCYYQCLNCALFHTPWTFQQCDHYVGSRKATWGHFKIVTSNMKPVIYTTKLNNETYIQYEYASGDPSSHTIGDTNVATCFRIHLQPRPSSKWRGQIHKYLIPPLCLLAGYLPHFCEMNTEDLTIGYLPLISSCYCSSACFSNWMKSLLILGHLVHV